MIRMVVVQLEAGEAETLGAVGIHLPGKFLTLHRIERFSLSLDRMRKAANDGDTSPELRKGRLEAIQKAKETLDLARLTIELGD